MNETCPHCGWWIKICKCNDNGIFHTSKDKLWEFETWHLGKRYEIRGKDQWKKFMKKHGLHDDVSKKVNFTKPSYKSVPRKVLADCMLKELHEKGLKHKLVPELRKALKRR